jgi:hypothetical protein
MSVKGSLSDGLKRAAVLWGVGRYLYRLPKTWVSYDNQKKRLTEIPALPRWALPAGEMRSTTGINRLSGETAGVPGPDVAKKAA